MTQDSELRWLSISTILYCIVADRSSRSSVGVTLSLFSSIIRTWSATSAGHRLAQG